MLPTVGDSIGTLQQNGQLLNIEFENIISLVHYFHVAGQVHLIVFIHGLLSGRQPVTAYNLWFCTCYLSHMVNKVQQTADGWNIKFKI